MYITISEVRLMKSLQDWYDKTLKSSETNVTKLFKNSTYLLVRNLHLVDCLVSCFDPDMVAPAAAVTATAAAPSFTPPAALAAPAILAKAAKPPTSTALIATVGFTLIFSVSCNIIALNQN